MLCSQRRRWLPAPPRGGGRGRGGEEGGPAALIGTCTIEPANASTVIANCNVTAREVTLPRSFPHPHQTGAPRSGSAPRHAPLETLSPPVAAAHRRGLSSPPSPRLCLTLALRPPAHSPSRCRATPRTRSASTAPQTWARSANSARGSARAADSERAAAAAAAEEEEGEQQQ